MNLKRLFRLAAFSGLIAVAVAAARSLTRDRDPLPSPAGGPSDPWPPLRSAEPSTASRAGTATITPDPDPTPAVEAEPTTLATVPDTQDAAPVADETSGAEDAVETAEVPTADEQQTEWVVSDDDWDEDDVVDPSAEEDEQKAETADDDSDSAATRATTKSRRRRREPLRAPWMPPNDDGSCPDGYPLKANDQSKIFHAPGQMSYDRTVPERCYADAEVAVADGYRAAKR